MMASQATSTMDLSFGGYDDYPQMGDLVSQLAWEPDAICVSSMVGIKPADVYSAAPEGLTTECSSDLGLLLKSADWKAEDDFPLSADLGTGLSDYHEWDLSQMNVETPRTVDASQASADEIELNFSLRDCSDILSIGDVPFESSKNVSSPGSPDSGIGSLEAASSPCSDTSFEAAVCPDSEHMTTLTVSQEDLALLESLWNSEPAALESLSAPQTGSQALLTAVTLHPSSHSTPLPQVVPPTPESLKPSKSPSARTPHEKKQRKRAQNKNAATRYREKKREEAKEIYLKQTKEEEKNKGLRDKVTLISREIEYMKELLIEVYRAKGIIE